ncbi:MAG: copper resistance protein CopC, partial [Actinobacteria bacterium]|nr:copper resistance protein CopC [Actinomycetota bacterium]
MAAILAMAGPAGAHAELRSSEPVDGQVVTKPPADVVLRFSEPVEVSFGAIRVYRSDGRRLDVGPPRHPRGDGHAVSVALPELDTGSYV